MNLPVSSATAEPLSEREVHRLIETGEGVSVPGNWLQVRASLPRVSAEKIAGSELYTHLRVENCRSGETVGIASNVSVDGTDGDFDRLRKHLKADPTRSEFVLSEPIFIQAGEALDGLCLRIEGGSYMLQKVASVPVPLKVRKPRA